MAAFIIATVQVTDPEAFSAYGKANAGLSEKFGGEYLVRGVVSEVLEGNSTIGERVVVVRFAHVDSARAYLASPEYQFAKLLREGAAVLTMRLMIEPN